MASLDDFDEIVEPHMDRLYSFAYYLAGEEAEAKDVFQEAMVKIMNNFDRYEKGTNFKAWASRVMKNLFIDRTRKKSPNNTDFEKYEPVAREGTQPWTDVELMSNETLINRFFSDEVKEAVMDLPESYRMTLLLNAIHELSYEDISDVMDCPIGTVMSRLYRARQELKRSLSDVAERYGLDSDPEERQKSTDHSETR